MAHPTIIAKRQAIAFEKLMVSASKLAKRHNLQAQLKGLEGAKSRDPNMAQVLQTEALAELMYALDKSTNTAASDTLGKEDPPLDKSAIQDAKKDADAPLTVETVDEEPLVTTETVQIVNDDAKTVVGAKSKEAQRAK